MEVLPLHLALFSDEHDRSWKEYSACSLGLIWLAESTAGWFFVREKYCWLAG
jgi:hypothetical protein